MRKHLREKKRRAKRWAKRCAPIRGHSHVLSFRMINYMKAYPPKHSSFRIEYSTEPTKWMHAPYCHSVKWAAHGAQAQNLPRS